MSNGSKRPAQKLGFLKATLVVGSVAATMLGADLLANRDQTPANNPPPAPTVVVPAREDQQQALTLNNAPVPRLVFPQVIARSRSSR